MLFKCETARANHIAIGKNTHLISASHKGLRHVPKETNGRFFAVVHFFTSRTEALREITEQWLDKHGFKYHGIIFGKPRGGNYHWIDNHIVKATRYKGKFTDFVLKEETIEVFND